MNGPSIANTKKNRSCIHMYIYIYIYMCSQTVARAASGMRVARVMLAHLTGGIFPPDPTTPNLPTKIVPTKIR